MFFKMAFLLFCLCGRQGRLPVLKWFNNIVILYFFLGGKTFSRVLFFFFVLKMIDICRIWRLTPRSCFTLSGDWSHWDSLIFSERTVDWEISIVNSSMLYSDASEFCSFGVRDTDWTADSWSPSPRTHRVSHWCAWALLRDLPPGASDPPLLLSCSRPAPLADTF